MIGTIVVPLDGSELSERALAYARVIANRTSAPTLLVRVVRAGASESDIEAARDYLRGIESQLDGRVQIVIEQGDPADEIGKIAEGSPDPMIVMSTHGRGGVRRLVAGSVAEEVVRTVGVPVLLVRADTELPRSPEIRNILVPVDGSPYAETALEYAITLAQAFQSQIHLLHVVDTPSAYAMLSRHMEVVATGNVLDDIIASMQRESEEYLDKLEKKLIDRGVSVKTVSLEGYPGEQVIEYERRGDFQLVVMATAGRSGISRVVFGSVAERVLKLGRSPVVMIRPQEEAEQSE